MAKSITFQTWEHEAEGALQGLVLNEEESFAPIQAVKEHVLKLAPETGAGHETLCIGRFRLDSNTEKQLNNMINVEYGMSYAFHSMSNYFARDCVALPGLAALFLHRSTECRDNAIELAAYLSKRGGCTVLKPIPAPEGEFNSERGDALYAMELTLAMEKAETDKFMALNKAAEDVVDEQLSDYITDTFLDKQVTLVNLHAKYVSQLRRVGKGHGHWDWDCQLAHQLGAKLAE